MEEPSNVRPSTAVWGKRRGRRRRGSSSRRSHMAGPKKTFHWKIHMVEKRKHFHFHLAAVQTFLGLERWNIGGALGHVAHIVRPIIFHLNQSKINVLEACFWARHLHGLWIFHFHLLKSLSKLNVFLEGAWCLRLSLSQVPRQSEEGKKWTLA